MPDSQSILDAHNRLCLIVSSGLHPTQELSRLLALKSEAVEMLRLLNEVRNRAPIFCFDCTNGTRDQAEGFTAHEMSTMQQNCTGMVEAIDAVAAQIVDHDIQGSPVAVSQKNHTGKRGRPAIEVDAVALQQLLELRGPGSTGELLGCSSKTVRRRALELGLVQPGAPVITHEVQPDGSISSVFHRRESQSNTDEEVCAAVSAVLETYPDFGREKLLAAVKAQGVSATRRQVEATLLLLRGPSESRNRRPIQRRVYTVPGSNYLWHHDGQHGLFSCTIVLSLGLMWI